MKRKFLLLFILFSCGKHTPPLENHGDIVDDNKLIITRDNHPELAGQRDCFLCHQEYSIHQEDRSRTLNLNLESIQQTVREGGINSCSQCHGNNNL